MFSVPLFYILIFLVIPDGYFNLYDEEWNPYANKYGSFSEEKRLKTLNEVKNMFYFGYDNYMKYAFPQDELDPIHCVGRGPDYENPSNININDVLGDYALTLIDTLDTLALMGNGTEFKNAVQLVIEFVSFDKPSTVQVFEANIRIIGGLLSAHLILLDEQQPFGDMSIGDYDSELLHMAHDLAARLLPAFENTATGIPYPRVHLQNGVPHDCVNTTCLAGAGSLLLEFGILSRLLRDPVYESLARRTVAKLWKYRSNVTGLFGNVINIQTGAWASAMSGVGAGLDSFFEYLLKSFILFGYEEDLRKFNESYETIKYYLRKGRKKCNTGVGIHPMYVNVNMKNGDMLNNWVDSLQAAWPGVQVLQGDVEEAICSHALHYMIWRRYGALPERYNWHLKSSEVSFYPLRPELIESTYLLYRATKNPFYLHVGKDIVDSINNYTKVKCGYATIHDVNKKDLEDRMESFFLSETCKYLYLLFDSDNHLNKKHSDYIFTTEGHIIPLSTKWRRKPWDENVNFYSEEKSRRKNGDKEAVTNTQKPNQAGSSNVVVTGIKHNSTFGCDNFGEEKRYFLPIKSTYLRQLEAYIGVGDSL